MPTFRVAQSQIELHQGDCLELLPALPEASVDVVVTSPPYNIGVRYGAYDDTGLSRQEYLDWLADWALQVRRVLKPDGSLFLNLGSKPTDPWVPFEVVTRLKEILAMQNVIHWIKSIAIEKAFVGEGAGLAEDLTVGHYKPINSNRFLNDCHEYVFHLTHRGDVGLDRLAVGVPYQDKSNLRRWSAAASDRHSDRPHPASFPVELARKCILLHGACPGLKVMDPFLGIGHSALAAIQTGSDFLGCELDPEYFEVACRAVQEAVPPPRTEAAAPREAQSAQMELF